MFDLRNFQTADASIPPKPLARFQSHRTPITSLEWHPTDESMIAVSDDNGTYVYDLSIEEDDPENKKTIPQIFGKKGAIFLAFIMLLIAQLFYFKVGNYGAVILSFLTMFVVLFSFRPKPDWYYLFILDGLLIIFPFFALLL